MGYSMKSKKLLFKLKKHLLTHVQRLKLIMALATKRDTASFTANEVKKIVLWAERILLEYGILKSIMRGRILIDVTNESCNDFSDLRYYHAKRYLGEAEHQKYIRSLLKLSRRFRGQ